MIRFPAPLYGFDLPPPRRDGSIDGRENVDRSIGRVHVQFPAFPIRWRSFPGETLPPSPKTILIPEFNRDEIIMPKIMDSFPLLIVKILVEFLNNKNHISCSTYSVLKCQLTDPKLSNVLLKPTFLTRVNGIWKLDCWSKNASNQVFDSLIKM